MESQTGESSLKTIKVNDKVHELEAKIDSLMVSLGLFKNEHNPEVEQFFFMTLQEIRALSLLELNEANILLASYSLFIKQKENSVSGIVRWCANILDNLTAKEAPGLCKDSTYRKFEEKRGIVIHNNDYAKALDAHMGELYLILSQLRGICDGIQFLADQIKGIILTKKSIGRVDD